MKVPFSTFQFLVLDETIGNYNKNHNYNPEPSYTTLVPAQSHSQLQY